MDKETLSNYGWIVILVLILAVMIALASPFGSFVSTAIKDVTGGFWDVNSASLNAVGLDSDNLGFPAECNIEGHYTNDGRAPHKVAVTNCSNGHTYTCECDRWVVPEFGKYTMNSGTIYTAGQQLPCGYTAVSGDKYVDKYYTYNYSDDGWSVSALDKTLTSYGEILKSITNKPITNMYNTFRDCTSLTTTPVIPNSVTNMGGTFAGCKSLTTAPIIPHGVTIMASTFANCTNLKTYVGSKDIDGDFSNYNIPDSVTNMEYTFTACESLVAAPAIPDSVTNIGWTFCDCISLTKAPAISSKISSMSFTFYNCKSLTLPPDMSKAISITNMWSTFENCTSLTTTPIIPNKITHMTATFKKCKSLTTAPVIPNGIATMNNTFAYCTSLKTAPIIPNSVKEMDCTFIGCSSLKTAPIIPNNVTSMYSTFESCTSLTTAPVIPNTVRDMRGAFQCCTSLTGTIEIDANPSVYSDCFSDANFKTQNIKLTGASTILDKIGATGTNYCATCNGTCSGTH